MLLKILEKNIYFNALQDEFRRIGVNFVTAGIVGVFINHFVGSQLSTMFWTAFWITVTGITFLAVGLIKFNKG